MCFNKDNKSCCCFTAILSALLGAAGIAAVFFSGLIGSIITLIYITLILGILGLIFLFIPSCNRDKYCNIFAKSCLVPSIVGSIITSIFALTLSSLATFSIPVAILIGVIAFFLILSLINLVNIILEFTCNN